jgi:hypothetical protein
MREIYCYHKSCGDILLLNESVVKRRILQKVLKI